MASQHTPTYPVDADIWHSGGSDSIRAVLDAATRADGQPPLDEAALLALRRPITETRMVVAGPDAADTQAPLSGFGWLHGGAVDLVVAPQARGHGIGAALFEALEAPPGPLTGWSHGDHPAAARLAERFGFTRARELWVMRRPLEDLPDPAETAEPRGPGAPITVRAFGVGRDEEAFLAVNATAFADHREQGQLTRGDLDERMAEEWFDPDGFFVAEAGGRVVGFHWTKVHPGPAGVGEVYVLGVSPQAQGSGLGRRLALVGLHHLADRGCREVMLFVESDNSTAVALYSRLGFAHAETHVQYARC